MRSYFMYPQASNLHIDVPGTNMCLVPGCTVKLGRFEQDIWLVQFGWYSFGGNRPVCGWYLSKDNGLVIKPLQLPDLDDIYMITS